MPLLTTAEVAAREGVKQDVVSYWCLRGDLFPAVKIGRRWWIYPGYDVQAVRSLAGPMGRRKSGRPVGRPKGARDKRKRKGRKG